MNRKGALRGIAAVALATAVLFAGIAYHERSNRDVAALVEQTGANLIYVSFPKPISPATLDKIKRFPGVASAAGQGITSYFYAPGTKYSIGWMLVSPNYVSTVGLKLAEGHGFTSNGIDDEVIIGSEVRDAIFAGKPAIGKSLGNRTVIGVLAPIPSDDFIRQRLNRLALTTVLQSHPGLDTTPRYSLVFVRSIGPPTNAVKSLSAAFPTAQILPIEKLYSFSVALARIINRVLMVAAFGLVVLAAVLIGILLTLSVQRRIREIGIRRAVGATPRAIRTQLACEGLKTVGIGGEIGLLIGVIFTVVSFPATAFSWLHLVILPAVTFAVLPGILFPAFQAARIPPVEALRRRTILPRQHRLNSAWVLIGVGLALGFLFAFVANSTSRAIHNYIHWAYGGVDARTLIVRAPRESILLGPDLTEHDGQTLAKISGIQSVVPVVSQRINSQATAAAVGKGIAKLKFPPVVDGRGLDTTDFADHTPVCMVSESFVKHGGATLGATIDVKGTPFKVVGVFRDAYIRAEFPIDILIPAGFSRILPIAHVWFLVHLASHADIEMVKKQIIAELAAEHPKRAKVEVMSVIGRQAKFVAFFKQGEMRMIMTAAAALLLATGEAITLVQFMLERRKQEIGIKRAIGATPGRVVLSVVEEAALLPGAAAVVAVLAGAVLTPIFIGWFIYLKPPPWWTSAPLIGGLVLIVVAISTLPVASVWRMPPAELIEQSRE